MHGKRLAKILSNLFEPWRVFIALMLAAGFWLLLTFAPQKTPPAIGRTFVQGDTGCVNKWDCANGHCCGGECQDDACGGGAEPTPIPLTISAAWIGIIGGIYVKTRMTRKP